MAPGLADRVLAEADEMADVAAYEAPAFARSEGQLRRVGQPTVADFMGTDGVDSPAPQRGGCGWGQVLIEVEPQRRRAALSCRAFRVSWSASFSPIRVSISSQDRS